MENPFDLSVLPSELVNYIRSFLVCYQCMDLQRIAYFSDTTGLTRLSFCDSCFHKVNYHLSEISRVSFRGTLVIGCRKYQISTILG
jgi:hypothetical protein